MKSKSVTFTMPEEDLTRLDDYRYDMRMTRSEALRRIIDYFFWALENLEKEEDSKME